MKVIVDIVPKLKSDDMVLMHHSNPLHFADLLSKLSDTVTAVESAQVFIDNETIENFISSTVDVFEDNQALSPKHIKRKYLQSLSKFANADFFRKYTDYDASFFYCFWQNEDYCTKVINGELLANIAEFTLRYEEEILLFSLDDTNATSKRYTIMKDNLSPEYSAEAINLNCTNSSNEVSKWIDRNRRKRKFRLHRKHGLAGEHNYHGQSVLHCNNEEEAQELLNRAKKFGSGSDLYLFDTKRKQWIVFKNDNFRILINEEVYERYHGYHVEKDKEYSQIPPEVAAAKNNYV